MGRRTHAMPSTAQMARLNSFESVRDQFSGSMATSLVKLPALTGCFGGDEFTTAYFTDGSRPAR